jgi:hypothetical protein
MRRHKSLFKYLAFAVRTPRRLFKDVFRSHGIASGDVIQEKIKSEFRIFHVAVLAKGNEVLGPLQNRRGDQYDGKILGPRIEEVLSHWITRNHRQTS